MAEQPEVIYRGEGQSEIPKPVTPPETPQPERVEREQTELQKEVDSAVENRMRFNQLQRFLRIEARTYPTSSNEQKAALEQQAILAGSRLENLKRIEYSLGERFKDFEKTHTSSEINKMVEVEQLTSPLAEEDEIILNQLLDIKEKEKYLDPIDIEKLIANLSADRKKAILNALDFFNELKPNETKALRDGADFKKTLGPEKSGIYINIRLEQGKLSPTEQALDLMAIKDPKKQAKREKLDVSLNEILDFIEKKKEGRGREEKIDLQTLIDNLKETAKTITFERKKYYFLDKNSLPEMKPAEEDEAKDYLIEIRAKADLAASKKEDLENNPDKAGACTQMILEILESQNVSEPRAWDAQNREKALEKLKAEKKTGDPSFMEKFIAKFKKKLHPEDVIHR